MRFFFAQNLITNKLKPQTMDKTNLRIQTKAGKFKFAGTGDNSWFNLTKARELVNYKAGERIVEIYMPTGEILWEKF